MQDIHAIRPPVPVGINATTMYILLGVLIAILISLLVFFLVRKWLRNRKAAEKAIDMPESIPPYKAAMNSLKRLSRSANIDPRLFYFDLTLVLRKYIGDCFCTTAAEMTSQEFIKSLGKIDLEKQIKQQIVRFQALCDPIKYAGIIPDHLQIQGDLNLVEKMIEQIETRLVETRQSEPDTFEPDQGQTEPSERYQHKTEPREAGLPGNKQVVKKLTAATPQNEGAK